MSAAQRALELRVQAETLCEEFTVELERMRSLVKMSKRLVAERSGMESPFVTAAKRDLSWAAGALLGETEDYKKRRAHLRVLK